MLTILARITPKPKFFEAIREAILDIIVVTRGEPGCHAFILYNDGGDQKIFYVYEIWEDEKAFQEHREKPHTQNAADKCREGLLRPIEITRLYPIYK